MWCPSNGLLFLQVQEKGVSPRIAPSPCLCTLGTRQVLGACCCRESEWQTATAAQRQTATAAQRQLRAPRLPRQEALPREDRGHLHAARRRAYCARLDQPAGGADSAAGVGAASSAGGAACGSGVGSAAGAGAAAAGSCTRMRILSVVRRAAAETCMEGACMKPSMAAEERGLAHKHRLPVSHRRRCLRRRRCLCFLAAFLLRHGRGVFPVSK